MQWEIEQKASSLQVTLLHSWLSWQLSTPIVPCLYAVQVGEGTHFSCARFLAFLPVLAHKTHKHTHGRRRSRITLQSTCSFYQQRKLWSPLRAGRVSPRSFHPQAVLTLSYKPPLDDENEDEDDQDSFSPGA